MLTRRVAAVLDAGLLERHRDCKHPPRHEYLLTQRGQDLQQVIVAIQARGNRHFAPDGPNVEIVDSATGATADPVPVDRHPGRPLTRPELIVAPGPGASERMRRKIVSSTWGRAPLQGAGRLPWPLLGGFFRLLVAIGGGWLMLRLIRSVNGLFAAFARARHRRHHRSRARRLA